MFAALAQLERETTLQRQYEGIQIAKANGVYAVLFPWDEILSECFSILHLDNFYGVWYTTQKDERYFVLFS